MFILTAGAQTICQPIYGGGQTCVTPGNVSINKKVQNPQTRAFADNLGVSDARLQPDSIVTFQILVTNARQTNINRVEIRDIFPPYVNFDKGPGSYNVNTKNLVVALDNLKPNETRTINITGKIVGLSQLPGNQAVICTVNQSIATTNDGSVSQDNAQFCIQKEALGTQTPTTKGGLPVEPSPSLTTIPSTGPDGIVLLSTIPLAIAGLLLKKYSLKKEDIN